MKLILISIRKREARAMLKGDNCTHDAYPGSKSGANLNILFTCKSNFPYYIYIKFPF